MGLLLARLAQMPQDIETRELLSKLEEGLLDMQARLDGVATGSLPGRVKADFSHQPTTPQMALFSLQGCRVLVVEDDAVLGHAFELMLQSWGCEVCLTQDLPEAQGRVLGGWLPDVMISEYRLGHAVNGIDVLLALRGMLGQPIASCLVSGNLDPDFLQRAAAQGLGVLAKPVRPAKLRILLRNMLQSRALPSEA
jgi:CheY-like chemotaxis protein